MKKSLLVVGASMALAAMMFTACKKDKKTEESSNNTTTPTAEKKYALVIENGAQAIDQGQTLSYKAHLVSTSGTIIDPSGVSWSSNIGGMAGSVFTFAKDTTGIISASVEYEGVTYKAAVPVCVNPLKNTQVFAVVPSAIIWSTNSGPIQLNTVYMGNGGATYAFSSDNAGVASVSNSGQVSFNAVGNTRIKVTATINGQANVVYVPVMVVGLPEVTLPVTRIVITPALGEMFRGETLQLSAKAYNSNGDDVSSTVSFSYKVIPKQEDDEIPTPAVSVNGSGLVTANVLGGAYVQATANGVIGQSEIVVNPDTVILVSPFFTTLGTDFSQFPPVQKTSENFTAATYKVDRTAYRNKAPNFLLSIPNPANMQWDVPTTGVPEIDSMFDVVTLSNKTNNSCTATAKSNKFGSTFIVAHAGDNGGGAGILVNP